MASGGRPSLSFNFAAMPKLDERITFSRGSNATQFNAAGLLVYAPANLLTYSEDFSNSAWTKQSTVSIATDQIAAPNGTTTADLMTADAGLGVYQQLTVAIGTQVTQSIYIKAGTATAVMFRDDTGAGRHIVVNPTTGVITATSGTLIESGSVSVGNGWYRIYFSYAADTVNVRGILRPDTGTAVTVYIWGAQTNRYPILNGITSSLSTYYPTTTTAYYGPRFDYSPSTLAAQGLLIEESRTNSIRNNTMQGAVAGTPGTLPSISGTPVWSTFTTLTGLTREVVGTGIENGITYIDIRVSGTPSAAGSYGIYFETNTGISASNGQTWAQTAYLKLQAGSLTGIPTLYIQQDERSSVGYLRTNASSPLTITSAALATQRYGFTATLTGGVTVANLIPYILFNLSGVAIDITLRIGLPQLELGAFATSVIPTTVAQVTRNPDVASVNTLSPWFNSTAGTIYAEFVLTQPAAGANQFLARFSDNSYNNSIADNVTGGGFAQLATASGGVFDGTASTAVAVSANTVTKFAGAYASDDLAACKDSGTVAVDPSATIPSGLTRFDLGSDHAGANRIKAGYLRRITYYPRRLSNAELVSITS